LRKGEKESARPGVKKGRKMRKAKTKRVLEGGRWRSARSRPQKSIGLIPKKIRKAELEEAGGERRRRGAETALLLQGFWRGSGEGGGLYKAREKLKPPLCILDTEGSKRKGRGVETEGEGRKRKLRFDVQ